MKSIKKSKVKIKKPLVAIVIVNWNGGQTVINCIESLALTDYPNFKVILVDNGSSDDSLEKILKIRPDMHVIKLVKNHGYTIGTNTGWRYGLDKLKADYICAMDSDIVTVQKNWLSLEIEELEKSGNYGVGCGKLTFPDGRVQLLFHEREHSQYIEKDIGQYDFIRETKAVGGACIIIKRKTIEKIGYYDEQFFYGPNDIDYCFRANQAGFKVIYNGFAKSIHVGSFSGRSGAKDFIYGHQSYGQMVFWFRHGNWLNAIKTVKEQFVRVFITRVDPYKIKSVRNTLFHKSFPKRLMKFFKSWYMAAKDYRNIHNETSAALSI